MRMPTGEIFMNEVKKENSIAFTDNPDTEEIDFYFGIYKQATNLIYIKGNTKKEYYR